MAHEQQFSEIDVEEELLDGMIAQASDPQVSCFLCRHLKTDMISCRAFPSVIPEKISSGIVRHVKAIGGEKKKRGKPILFEPKEKTE